MTAIFYSLRKAIKILFNDEKWWKKELDFGMTHPIFLWLRERTIKYWKQHNQHPLFFWERRFNKYEGISRSTASNMNTMLLTESSRNVHRECSYILLLDKWIYTLKAIELFNSFLLPFQHVYLYKMQYLSRK